jgi:hypothetical protein
MTWLKIKWWAQKAWGKNGRVVLMYFASVLGALSKIFFDTIMVQDAYHLSIGQVVLCFVVSGVTFPLLYEAINKEQRSAKRPSILIYFSAYQSGFFWLAFFSKLYSGYSSVNSYVVLGVAV